MPNPNAACGRNDRRTGTPARRGPPDGQECPSYQLDARSALGLLVFGLLLLAGAGPLAAQQTWEYSPYGIKVWLAFGNSAELNEQTARRIQETIAQRAWTVAGSTWDVEAVRCPAAVLVDVLTNPDSLSVEAVGKAAPEVLKQADKLFLLVVRDRGFGHEVEVRELDCRTRVWRGRASRMVVQPAALADEAFSALLEAFIPLVRIESAKGSEAQVRIRAGGLIMDERSPAAIPVGADDKGKLKTVLLPIIRRNDRLGEPMAGGIQVVPWTFLSPTGQKGSVLQCKVYSGMHGGLAGRASARVVKLALLAKPRHASTDLVLQTEEEHPVPLQGYDVYAKDPVTEDSELIGASDWRGRVRISKGDQPLLILYVRSGGLLLARLPLAPGLEAELPAQITNDDVRLQAEGFVKGLQSRIMDAVARRELYVARFRRALQEKKLDKAKTLLEEFGRLENRSDLATLVNQQEQRLTSQDRRVQAKIDQLFSQTRQLLAKFLDPQTSNKLNQEYLQATKG